MDFFSGLAIFPFIFLGGHLTDLPGISTLPGTGEPLHGIYLTSDTVGYQRADETLDEFKKLGGNMVVFDVQDNAGRLAYPSNVPVSIEIENRRDQIKDLTAAVNSFKEKGFYVVARFVLFKNSYLARHKPEWTLKHKGTQAAFVSRDGPIWMDPGHAELKKYLIDISREIALAGADEVQFDYVRFPDGPKPGASAYSYTGSDTKTRDEVITAFVGEAAKEIRAAHAKVSVDMFGIVVWDNVSWKLIGQNVHEIAKYVDVIYPMPYPSHFGAGWGGHRNPADEPYFFVQETTKKFIEQAYPGRARVRPWLQGFALNANNYGPQYVQDQIKALSDIGIDEYAVWNARNDYSITFKGFRR